jgi:hypothetical protein
LWVKGEIFNNLDDVAISARGSLDRHAQSSLFDRLEWFRRTYQFASPDGIPLIFRARSDGSDCYLFLFAKQRVAQALGSWYTLNFRPVFTGLPDEKTKMALLVAIARRLKKEVGRVSIGPMSVEDADLVRAAFDRARWISSIKETTVCWTVATENLSYADYIAARPGEVRSTIKRKRNKFGISTTVFDRFDGVAWDAYQQIYAESWKPKEGSPEFLRDMALAEGIAGTLRLGLAYHEDKPVAGQLWTVENGHAIIHKLSHLEAAVEMSPGTILTAAMFEHALDRDHVALVDFGTGDDRYKRDWMDTRTPLMAITLNNPLSRKGFAGVIHGGIDMLVGRRASV